MQHLRPLPPRTTQRQPRTAQRSLARQRTLQPQRWPTCCSCRTEQQAAPQKQQRAEQWWWQEAALMVFLLAAEKSGSGQRLEALALQMTAAQQAVLLQRR